MPSRKRRTPLSASAERVTSPATGKVIRPSHSFEQSLIPCSSISIRSSVPLSRGRWNATSSKSTKARPGRAGASAARPGRPHRATRHAMASRMPAPPGHNLRPMGILCDDIALVASPGIAGGSPAGVGLADLHWLRLRPCRLVSLPGIAGGSLARVGPADLYWLRLRPCRLAPSPGIAGGSPAGVGPADLYWLRLRPCRRSQVGRRELDAVPGRTCSRRPVPRGERAGSPHLAPWCTRVPTLRNTGGGPPGSCPGSCSVRAGAKAGARPRMATAIQVGRPAVRNPRSEIPITCPAAGWCSR